MPSPLKLFTVQVKTTGVVKFLFALPLDVQMGAVGHSTRVINKTQGAFHILKTPEDSSCLSEGN